MQHHGSLYIGRPYPNKFKVIVQSHFLLSHKTLPTKYNNLRYTQVGSMTSSY